LGAAARCTVHGRLRPALCVAAARGELAAPLWSPTQCFPHQLIVTLAVVTAAAEVEAACELLLPTRRVSKEPMRMYVIC
jgi:hypothetical protein